MERRAFQLSKHVRGKCGVENGRNKKLMKTTFEDDSQRSRKNGKSANFSKNTVKTFQWLPK
jgi:hypothetical protein